MSEPTYTNQFCRIPLSNRKITWAHGELNQIRWPRSDIKGSIASRTYTKIKLPLSNNGLGRVMLRA